MPDNGREPGPVWLEEASTPAEGFRKLVDHLSADMKDASQTEKIAEFREGVEAIRTHIGPITIAGEFNASFPGRSDENVVVFVGKPGPKGTPVIAFDASDRIWTGSVEASLGVTPDGRPVFNAFRANRRC